MNAASVSLGTLLVQRLDTLLGTTLAQQSNLVSGARPDAVSQAGRAERNSAADNKTQRHPQDNVNRASTRLAAAHTALAHTETDTSHTQNPAASGQLRLGVTARLILDLLRQFPQQMPVQQQTPLLRSAPGHVIASASLAAQFTHSLAQTLEQSGMFYESHLAQLALGQQSLAVLRAQPQANMPTETAQHTLAAEAQYLVRQQLEVLANQTFTWYGQAWPGADMQWDIAREPAQYAAHDPAEQEAPAGWRSQLSLQLPALGSVSITVTLQASALSIQLQAQDCAPALQAHAHTLRASLADTGLTLTQLSIVQSTAAAQTPRASFP